MIIKNNKKIENIRICLSKTFSTYGIDTSPPQKKCNGVLLNHNHKLITLYFHGDDYLGLSGAQEYCRLLNIPEKSILGKITYEPI